MLTQDITKCVPYFGEWMCILFEDLEILTITDKLKCLSRVCMSSKPRVGRLREQVRSHRGRAGVCSDLDREQTNKQAARSAHPVNKQAD